jgi:hypothetical protein
MREPENNAEAAWIIFEDPARYEGLPLEWARLWVERHGPARKPVVKAERTLEDRLAAHEEKQRKKKIARRRESWQQPEWRRSRKGNAFTNVHGFHIVVFQRNAQWSIGISGCATDEMTFGPKRYASEDEALAAAFDALLYMESKRSVTSLQFVQKAA